LGLAISKAIVDAHGGTLTVTSEGKGKGATFTVELVGAELPAETTFGTPGANSDGQKRALRILLVEDHGDTARIMARKLSGAGHAVTTADTVAAALAEAESSVFDLVISDLGLPDGSGLDLMNRLRPLPGIALTGYGMEEDVKKTREAGFIAHLTKPVDVGQLEATIEEVALDI
jgi:CheY-like chemotaxis protein